MNEGHLIPAPNLCQRIQFTFVIATLNPAWINAYHGVLGGLAKVTDAPRMAALTQEIRSIIDASGLSEAQRFARVRASMRRELNANEQTRSLAVALRESSGGRVRTFSAMLARPQLAASAVSAALAHGDAFTSSLSIVTGIAEERLATERIGVVLLRRGNARSLRLSRTLPLQPNGAEARRNNNPTRRAESYLAPLSR